MGQSKISVTIPDEIYNEINEMASKEKEEAYIQQVNKAFEDNEILAEQRQMAELIADNTDVEELPW